MISIERLATPIGTLLLAVDPEGRLRATDWLEREERLWDYVGRALGEVTIRSGRASAVYGHVARYFDGEVASLDRVPVDAVGTPFQRAVWDALRRIPCGATVSYAELAATIGRPTAVRAVGAANGANPIGVVVPCHRVIGADGSLTGYGGGIERKRWLLDHEFRGRAREVGFRVVEMRRQPNGVLPLGDVDAPGR